MATFTKRGEGKTFADLVLIPLSPLHVLHTKAIV